MEGSTLDICPVPPEFQVATPQVSGVHKVVGGGTESALRGGVVMAGVRRHYYP